MIGSERLELSGITHKGNVERNQELEIVYGNPLK